MSRFGRARRARSTNRTGARALLGAVAVLLAALVLPFTAGTAGAQFDDDDALRACGLYTIVLSTGGETLIEAATELALSDEPAPPGIAAALDTLIEAESDDSAGDEATEALVTLSDYYDPICQNLDQCPLVEAIEGDDRERAAIAAAHLRDLNRPNPPGIGIALQGLIDPETDPDDYARFRAQVLGWFTAACDQPAPDDDDTAGSTSSGGSPATTSGSGSSGPDASANAGSGTSDPGPTSGTGDSNSLPNTGFGSQGMFLIFMAFVAFTVGAGFMVAADR